MSEGLVKIFKFSLTNRPYVPRAYVPWPYRPHLKALALLAGFMAVGLLAATQPLHAQQASKSPVPKTQAGATVTAVKVPAFRHIDPLAKNPDFKAFPIIRFAVSDDFPPFSYRNQNNVLTGFNVLIATTICKTLRVECRFVVQPFETAQKSVENGLADVLLTGLRQTTDLEKTLSFTRPYFRFSARFSIRQAASIKTANVRSLAGKRLGVVAGTYHARYLKMYFSRSKLREFDTANDAFEALRTGAIDALFGDSVKHMFWLTGDASKGCCRFVGDAFLDPSSFSQPMSIAVKKDNHKLLNLMDHALDRLQVTGRYEKIYRQYFPLSVWKN